MRLPSMLSTCSMCIVKNAQLFRGQREGPGGEKQAAAEAAVAAGEMPCALRHQEVMLRILALIDLAAFCLCITLLCRSRS